MNSSISINRFKNVFTNGEKIIFLFGEDTVIKVLETFDLNKYASEPENVSSVMEDDFVLQCLFAIRPEMKRLNITASGIFNNENHDFLLYCNEVNFIRCPLKDLMENNYESIINYYKKNVDDEYENCFSCEHKNINHCAECYTGDQKGYLFSLLGSIQSLKLKEVLNTSRTAG